MIFDPSQKVLMPKPGEALPGRTEKMPVPAQHFVNGNPLEEPYSQGLEKALFGMGCFWGAERKFWQQEGVFVTAVGYSAGYTPNPVYQEVCSGLTGHNEVVLVVFDPLKISYEFLLKVFWESHNPTQGMQQGGDTGTQYRSGIYTYSAQQQQVAKQSLQDYQKVLSAAGYGEVTTEVLETGEFYFAEPDHQQYLAKNPAGYCGLRETGVAYC